MTVPVVRIIARRLLLGIPLLVLVSALTFLLVALTPGDAAQEILGAHATPQAYASLRRALGLNLPLYQQYWDWARHALTGDLGRSLLTDQPVTHALNTQLPVTLSLVMGAVLVTAVIGIAAGVISAVYGGVLGRAIDVFALVGFALPAFWVGAELIALFAVRWKLLPATGYVPVTQSVTGWLRSIALPIAALALGGIAAVAKQTREAMLDTLSSEYVRMARANGIGPCSIILRHALKNASVRALTVLGVQAVVLLGGTVLIENVFALPGLGSLVVSAATGHDLPVVQGVAIYFTGLVVVINLTIDLAYTALNPKVRVR